jgi:PleD family two-component response regulator
MISLGQHEKFMNENHQKTVLVVEDHDEISQNMGAMLIRKGYGVVNAIDADGAMKLAEHDRPAMILTDLDLPTLDPLISRLRAHATLKNLLVAVIDMDHPRDLRPDLTILNNFDELDQFLTAAPVN